jgi:DNA modification methylase
MDLVMSNAPQVEMLALSSLKPHPRWARKHPKGQIRKLCRSFKRHGCLSPLQVDENDVIIAGHARYMAAQELGLEHVPCIRRSFPSEADKKAYALADNRIAQDAEWVMEIVADDLKELLELGFDAELTGFDQPEIDRILFDADEASVEKTDPSDKCPPLSSSEDAVIRPGELWRLDRHLLLCGDATDFADVQRLLWGASVDMVFIDPPWNVPVQGHVSGLGRVKHREFVQASGEMTPPEFTAFLQAALGNIARVCRDGAIVFVCIDWRHLRELLDAGYAVFTHLMNMCVWCKTNGGMGTFYRSQHELVFVWKVGDAAHTNNFGLGDKGRYRTNVWTYPGGNTFKAGRDAELAMHPTVKPVAMVVDAIRDVSDRGDIVLDTFGGSGTTLIAAERTGRTARLMELDPRYCDVTIRRWQQMTGKPATLTSTGASFDDVEADRLNLGPVGEQAA